VLRERERERGREREREGERERGRERERERKCIRAHQSLRSKSITGGWGGVPVETVTPI